MDHPYPLTLMKSLFTLVVLTALVAFGGAFLERWTIPGLENLPTANSVKARFNKIPEAEPIEDIAERRMQQRLQGGRPPGYFATDANSATTNRNQQLRKASKEMGVE